MTDLYPDLEQRVAIIDTAVYGSVDPNGYYAFERVATLFEILAAEGKTITETTK